MDEEQLGYLLSLNGVSMNYRNEYWVKFNVKQVAATPERPHGIKYNLSLHDAATKELWGSTMPMQSKYHVGLRGKSTHMIMYTKRPPIQAPNIYLIVQAN